jgi:hypothetical protein
LLKKIPTKWKYIIKRALTLFSLSLVGTFLAMTVLKQGVEVGRKVGHCEVACSVVGAQFTSLDGEARCQCEYGNGWVMTIPIDHGFFDYEEIETDEILENK